MEKNKEQVIKLPTPLPYQKEIIDWLDQDDVKFCSFLKSRQSGGSFLNKLLVMKWALTTQNSVIGYITPTGKLVKKFFKEIKKSLAPFIIDSNTVDLFIEFKSGSNLQFFTAESGDSIRGFQFTHLILDEAAFMTDDVFNLVISPTYLVTGKKIVMCSTPNGAQGFFHQYVNLGLDSNIGYKTKRINIFDNPFVPITDIENYKKLLPERVFRQEYLGEFLDGSGTVFSNFKNCIVEDPERKGKYYAAIDWGKGDYTVLTIINEKKQVVHIYRINGMEYTVQLKLIIEQLNIWKPILTISEENNIGQVINELLRQQYSGKIKTITLGNTFKKNMIEELVVAFEQGKIGIPNDEDLLRELQSFSCTYNPQTQNVKYSAPNGLHDDMVISLAYAYYAVNNMKTKMNFTFV